DLDSVKIVVAGAGAAGTAIVTLLLAAGVSDVLVWDRTGILSRNDDRLSPTMLELAQRTNPANQRGELTDALVGANVFIGVSAGNVLPAAALEVMADGAVVFPLANPTPDIDPVAARPYASVSASGRYDLTNQINNVRACPGFFRGLLDARATEISSQMLLSAAHALAAVVTDDQLNASYIVPSVFDSAVHKAVAGAVADAARAATSAAANSADPKT
ncbi:MAG: malic enzyme-like NAD(P)-binding protein, partial [Geodermatophilaceae bacterium]